MAIVSIQLFRSNAPQKFNATDTVRKRPQVHCILTITGDQKIGIRVVLEDGNDVVEALDQFQSTDKEKIRPSMRRFIILPRLLLRWQKVVHDFHFPVKPELSVFVPAELAHRYEGIDVFQLPLKVSCVSP